MSDNPIPWPAFPCMTPDGEQCSGLTDQQYAAIHLRVPDSGADWLDAMIRQSLRAEFARAVVAAVHGEGGRYGGAGFKQVAEHAVACADALLAELEKGGG